MESLFIGFCTVIGVGILGLAIPLMLGIFPFPFPIGQVLGLVLLADLGFLILMVMDTIKHGY